MVIKLENGNSPILTGGTSPSQVFDLVERYNLDAGLKLLKHGFHSQRKKNSCNPVSCSWTTETPPPLFLIFFGNKVRISAWLGKEVNIGPPQGK